MLERDGSGASPLKSHSPYSFDAFEPSSLDRSVAHTIANHIEGWIAQIPECEASNVYRCLARLCEDRAYVMECGAERSSSQATPVSSAHT